MAAKQEQEHSHSSTYSLITSRAGHISGMDRRAGAPELELPGFRFHPTEEELLEFYLKQVVHGKKLKFDIIPTVHLYKHDPWELPGLARIGEREWYFFVPRDRKQASGGRPSRTTKRGFWKATGSDRAVRSAADPKRLIGLKKTLVYYEGRAPRGTKTDWVMNEYRLPDSCSNSTPPKEDTVLCKVYRKAVSLKELEQRVALEEIARCSNTNPASPMDSVSSSDHEAALHSWATETEAAMKKESYSESTGEDPVLARPPAMSLPQLDVPKYNGLEWMQDPFLTQLRSPWTENWSPAYYAGVLNF